MTFTTLLVALTVGQTDASPLVESATFTPDAQYRAIEASPRLKIKARDGGTGSAVVVGFRDKHAYALTATHVLNVSAPIDADFFVRSNYGTADLAFTLSDITVVASKKTSDIALLKLPIGEKVPTVLKLAKPGQRPKTFPFSALSVGSDDGFSPRCQDDRVLAKRFLKPHGEAAFFWETQRVSRPGRSGGPLLDKDLRVIGICAANQNNLGYFVHTDEIHAWLKQLKPASFDWLWEAETGK